MAALCALIGHYKPKEASRTDVLSYISVSLVIRTAGNVILYYKLGLPMLTVRNITWNIL